MSYKKILKISALVLCVSTLTCAEVSMDRNVQAEQMHTVQMSVQTPQPVEAKTSVGDIFIRITKGTLNIAKISIDVMIGIPLALIVTTFECLSTALSEIEHKIKTKWFEWITPSILDKYLPKTDKSTETIKT